MHNLDLILTLTASLAIATVLGYITFRLRLSPIVGYLVAGIALGPFTPGFVANRELAEQMAEVGVILLMFGVGLEFHLKELLAVRGVAIPGAVGQSLVATLLGMLVGLAFGWTWSAGIVFGLAISVASTVVLMRVLADNRDLHTPSGHIAVGWLVVEDLFTVVVLVLLPAIFGSGTEDTTPILVVLGIAVVKVAILVAFTFIVGGRVIPWLLERVARTGSRELFTLTVLVIALGIAVGAAELFGVSMALGAFLAGMVVGRSEFSLRAAADAFPMRDAFAVLFFVSIGMLFDPSQLLAHPGLVAATMGVILLGKPLAAFAIVVLLKYPLRVALAVAVALAQIGEFSFILATLGKQLHILSDTANNALVAAAIFSITINPLLYRLVPVAHRRLSHGRHLWPWLSQSEKEERRGPRKRHRPLVSRRHRAIIVGYGPVGRTINRLLNENGIETTIVEMNLETVRSVQSKGVKAIYGDASYPETLRSAGVGEVATMILSSAGMRETREIIRVARELNPSIRILARSVYLSDNAALRSAGADGVFSGEGEVALALTGTILRALGATSEQIDRERQRVHHDLVGETPSTTLNLAPPRSARADKSEPKPQSSGETAAKDEAARPKG